MARSIRVHQALILNWFAPKQEFSAGIVEGLNYRVKLTIGEAYGFRTLEAAGIALYHALGRLPEPKLPTNSAEEAEVLGWGLGSRLRFQPLHSLRVRRLAALTPGARAAP
ncbi:MAG: transposase [Phycisphaerales bacterium]|nr:transposase [Phycisphaerales bacterium]